MVLPSVSLLEPTSYSSNCRGTIKANTHAIRDFSCAFTQSGKQSIDIGAILAAN
jgi:hypothetical protein